MSYLRPASSMSGRARGRGGALPMGGNAIWDAIAPYIPGADPVAQLAAQVNRFGPGAPAGYQFAPVPLVASGNIDPQLAVVALTIYQRRATDAYSQFHDQGSAQAIAAANAGFADPVSFVSGNLSDVLTQVTGYGDSLGLPPAAGQGSSDDGTGTIFAAGAVVVLLLFMSSGKRKGRS